MTVPVFTEKSYRQVRQRYGWGLRVGRSEILSDPQSGHRTPSGQRRWTNQASAAASSGISAMNSSRPNPFSEPLLTVPIRTSALDQLRRASLIGRHRPGPLTKRLGDAGEHQVNQVSLLVQTAERTGEGGPVRNRVCKTALAAEGIPTIAEPTVELVDVARGLGPQVAGEHVGPDHRHRGRCRATRPGGRPQQRDQRAQVRQIQSPGEVGRTFVGLQRIGAWISIINSHFEFCSFGVVLSSRAGGGSSSFGPFLLLKCQNNCTKNEHDSQPERRQSCPVSIHDFCPAGRFPISSSTGPYHSPVRTVSSCQVAQRHISSIRIPAWGGIPPSGRDRSYQLMLIL